jgi:hypothetical protein
MMSGREMAAIVGLTLAAVAGCEGGKSDPKAAVAPAASSPDEISVKFRPTQIAPIKAGGTLDGPKPADAGAPP